MILARTSRLICSSVFAWQHRSEFVFAASAEPPRSRPRRPCSALSTASRRALSFPFTRSPMNMSSNGRRASWITGSAVPRGTDPDRTDPGRRGRRGPRRSSDAGTPARLVNVFSVWGNTSCESIIGVREAGEVQGSDDGIIVEQLDERHHITFDSHSQAQVDRKARHLALPWIRGNARRGCAIIRSPPAGETLFRR